MSEQPPTWQPAAPLDPTPATWQEQDDNDALAQLLAEQNMSLAGLRQFLDAAWAVVVAWDDESKSNMPQAWKLILAVAKLVIAAEAVTGKGPRAQDGT